MDTGHQQAIDANMRFEDQFMPFRGIAILKGRSERASIERAKTGISRMIRRNAETGSGVIIGGAKIPLHPRVILASSIPWLSAPPPQGLNRQSILKPGQKCQI